MQELISKEINAFASEVINVINDMNIYNLKENKKIDKTKSLFKTVGLDVNILNELINKKREILLIELQNLLDNYNLPITAKYENNNSIAFFFNTDKIGRLNIYGGDFDVFNTSIKKHYDKIDVLFQNTSTVLNKPKYKEEIILNELSVYTSYKTLDISIGHLNNNINSLKDKKQTFIKQRDKLKSNNGHNIDGLSYIMFKKSWIEYFNVLINSVDNDIENIKEFISYLNTIKTDNDNNDYIEILVIKNGLEDFLLNELKLSN